MKIRNGFVSNSSSASFIIGIAVVSNIDKFGNWIRENNLTNKIEIKLFSELEDNGYDPRVYNRTVQLEGFTGQSVEVNVDEIDPNLPDDVVAKNLLANNGNPYIAWFDDSGNDPSWDEDSEEYNYDDVDISWFDDDSQKMFEAFRNGVPGLFKGSCTYGAGRDG